MVWNVLLLHITNNWDKKKFALPGIFYMGGSGVGERKNPATGRVLKYLAFTKTIS